MLVPLPKDTYTDAELVAQLRQGSHAAFTEIYNRYWDKLFAVACHRLDDESEAEETVQDVFLSIWKRRDRLQLTHTLATYLSVAVKYQVVTRLARRQRDKERFQDLARNSAAGVETTARWLSEKELKEQIEKRVQALPEKCRMVFLMSREEGKTNAQIARELHIAEKTIEGHITKALTRLRKAFLIFLWLLFAIM